MWKEWARLHLYPALQGPKHSSDSNGDNLKDGTDLQATLASKKIGIQTSMLTTGKMTDTAATDADIC